jgi:hypothetical protein
LFSAGKNNQLTTTFSRNEAHSLLRFRSGHPRVQPRTAPATTIRAAKSKASIIRQTEKLRSRSGTSCCSRGPVALWFRVSWACACPASDLVKVHEELRRVGDPLLHDQSNSCCSSLAWRLDIGRPRHKRGQEGWQCAPSGKFPRFSPSVERGHGLLRTLACFCWEEAARVAMCP